MGIIHSSVSVNMQVYMAVCVYRLVYRGEKRGHTCILYNTWECIFKRLCINQGGNCRAWKVEAQSLFVFPKLAFITVAVLRWLSTVYACMCVCELERQRVGSGEGKIGSGRRWTARCLEGSPASSDSWIPSLTMSTTENVLLEGHIEDLTRITCNRTTQNIPILRHSHESFSTCAATNKTLRVPQITAWGVKPRTTVGSLRSI